MNKKRYSELSESDKKLLDNIKLIEQPKIKEALANGLSEDDVNRLYDSLNVVKNAVFDGWEGWNNTEPES